MEARLMARIAFESITEGERIVTARRTITEADIIAFAGISGDFNPLHTDELFAREHTPYGRRIAHGMLGAAVTTGLRSDYDDWDVLAFLECTRQFKGPIFPQDTVHAEFEVSEKRPSKSRPGTGIVVLDVKLVKQDGEVVQTGSDVVLVAGTRELDA
jgi:3-hydroxybutyryl-CoA dehydratase